MVKEIHNTQQTIKFYYNDKNHRVRKDVYINNNLDYIAHYVRDAAGTALAIYKNKKAIEHTIYGASRLGVHYRDSGNNVYQITDHLGNVRAVVERNKNNEIAALVATDYYPFGMPMPNRELGKNSYRYAYQGQEKDPETGKEAFQLRLWDSRIGRWLTTDPYGQFYSPYLGMGNNPISMTDPDGGYCPDCPDDGTRGVGNTGDTFDSSDGYTYTMGEDGIWWSDSAFNDLGTTITNHPYEINQNFNYSGWDVGAGVKGWNSFLNRGKPGGDTIAGRFSLDAMITFDGSNYSLLVEGFISTTNHPGNNYSNTLNIKYASDKSLRLSSETLKFENINRSHITNSGTSYVGGRIMLLPKDPNDLTKLNVILAVHRQTPLGAIGANLSVDLLSDIKK